ncbi:hypothetical protein FISHEDRAFT_32687 [Fistulina hepatica ATCC 64428]|uniref:MARVEL domain-containing protein n=1 Tax=Fistulina hepatica ATCC 64428 TaxID=1128425 RepID=A0A0D7AR37_9AGAR|nr:hypothetical protein FISHEDRAFT_32687 [Fistulina hepatica ATCC 64428]
MLISKPTIVFHVSQIFFNFLAMCCFASVAAFQAKWGVGPSGLSGFALFVSIAGIFHAAFMLLVPVIYEKYDRLSTLARALKEVRVRFILTTTGLAFSLLIAFVVTISAWTEAGCKNADNDPHESLGDSFKNGLSGWCNTKKAAAIFFWLAFASWLASEILFVLDWRAGRLHQGHREQPFQPPSEIMQYGEEDDERDEGSSLHQIPATTAAPAYAVAPSFNDTAYTGAPYDNSNTTSSPFADSNRYASAAPAGRQSMDAYGAFSDPAPSGFTPAPSFGTSTPPKTDTSPRVSRTMQYADPYAAVRASIVASQESPYQPQSGYR